MALTPDEINKIHEEELERYKARRRLEAFGVLEGEERELAEAFSADQKTRFVDADAPSRRKMLYRAKMDIMSKSERATFDKLKDTEQEALLALPTTERSQKLAQLKASSASTRGCFLLILLAIAAYIYADGRGMLRDETGSPNTGSEQDYPMDPSDVAELVEERLRSELREAEEKAFRTGDPADRRRAEALNKLWLDSMQNKGRIEIQKRLGR